MAAKAKPCVDCPAEVKTPRPAPNPGPRCATHHREITRARKLRDRENYVKRQYNMPAGAYQKLYEFQGGLCAICMRATGKGKRRLSVDHDHACCPQPPTCGKCTRGLLCGGCNTVLGNRHARDDKKFFERAWSYLDAPPAKRAGITTTSKENTG